MAGKSKVDDEVLDDLEEILVTSDVGVDTLLRLFDALKNALPAISMFQQASLIVFLKVR